VGVWLVGPGDGATGHHADVLPDGVCVSPSSADQAHDSRFSSAVDDCRAGDGDQGDEDLGERTFLADDVTGSSPPAPPTTTTG
jgi:hypothetical protein